MTTILPESNIKRIPPDPALRAAIRAAARARGGTTALSREALEALAGAVIAAVGVSPDSLGYAMVAVDNAIWESAFAAVPYARRLLLLPHCLRDGERCVAPCDAAGLHCARCGGCDIAGLTTKAQALGYAIVVAEGTSAVVLEVLEGRADAILGVACLDSLEKAFPQIAELGIPHQAIPLLSDGCLDTEADGAEIARTLTLTGPAPATDAPSYLPLLRETVALFAPASFSELLGGADGADAAPSDPQQATAAIALSWLRTGGKRLRPFITLAAYAVGRYGAAALHPSADLTSMLPPSVRCLALAIEAFHKASLVHDDLEDDDSERYGAPTLHRQYGMAPAINVGDYLVGLGYQLVARAVEVCGSGCGIDILHRLSTAHLALCRGQGTELLWGRITATPPTPLDVLTIYARKTAPAFEIALYAGLRPAGVDWDPAELARFAAFLGESYQVQDDLQEWQEECDTGRLARELLTGRPTLLRALAVEAGGGPALGALINAQAANPLALVAAARALYTELGVFPRAQRLRDRLRARALESATHAPTPALCDYLAFLVRMVLKG